ncbi:hypothetical protein FOXYSP1_14944 [Fusarium oxysporum f. sp. phaseoli]
MKKAEERRASACSYTASLAHLSTCHQPARLRPTQPLYTNLETNHPAVQSASNVLTTNPNGDCRIAKYEIIMADQRHSLGRIEGGGCKYQLRGWILEESCRWSTEQVTFKGPAPVCYV